MNQNKELQIEEKISSSECIKFTSPSATLQKKILAEIESVENTQSDFISPAKSVSNAFAEAFEKIAYGEFMDRAQIFKVLKACENKMRALLFIPHSNVNYIDYVVKNYGYSLQELEAELGPIPNPLINEILSSPLTLEEKCKKLRYVRI